MHDPVPCPCSIHVLEVSRRHLSSLQGLTSHEGEIRGGVHVSSLLLPVLLVLLLSLLLLLLLLLLVLQTYLRIFNDALEFVQYCLRHVSLLSNFSVIFVVGIVAVPHLQGQCAMDKMPKQRQPAAALELSH
jgi:hypothetical protein